MHKIETLKTGEFIDLDNWYREIESIVGKELTEEENIYYLSVIEKFFVLLGVDIPKTEQEYTDAFLEYSVQMQDIKSGYEFVYNPPELPSSTDTKESTIGNEYRKEFSEMYGGYTENLYLIASVFNQSPRSILEWNVIDYLFWSNYLIHKKWVENIK